MAYRQSNSRYFDRTYGVSRNDRLYRGRPAGNIVTGAAAAGVPFKPRDQNPLASRGRTRWWSAAPCDINGPGTRQGTEAIQNRDLLLDGRPLCDRRFTARAGEASTCSDPAARIRTPANRPEPRRSIASTPGNGRSGHRVCRDDPARARRSARPSAPARRPGRSAPDDGGNGRRGAPDQQVFVAAAHRQRVLRSADRVRSCLDWYPQCGAVGDLRGNAALPPLLGIVIAAGFPVALAVAVDPGWMLLVWVVLLFVGVELIVSNLLEPWIYGSTGLSSVALIAAATFWTWLWGPVGLLLSTPLTVCLVVLGRHVPQFEFLDVMLGNQPVLAPDETFYQRLLANDPEEATEQAEEFVKERSLAEFFDEVAIPALVMAQIDSDDGALLPERRLMIKQGVQAMLENLSDEATADPTSGHSTSPVIGGMPRILCIAGRNELDETAALLLVHLLRLEHPEAIAEALPAEALKSDRFQATLENAPVICLSLISTHSAVRARYLVRRLYRRAPRAQVLVGFWSLDAGELQATVATIARPNTGVATSLREAVAKLEPELAIRAPWASVG
jgi:AI-2E family transporter